MNFLGHSSISLKLDNKTLYGNFAGDFYKGRIENLELPKDVKRGLYLHRRIDTISDEENLLINNIDEKFGIFRSVISDIYIDHFLALEWKNIFDRDLDNDIKIIYSELDKYKGIYSDNFIELYSWIKGNNILFNYKYHENIKKTFIGMSKRVRRGAVLLGAYDELIKKYDLFYNLGIKEYSRVLDLISKEKF